MTIPCLGPAWPALLAAAALLPGAPASAAEAAPVHVPFVEGRPLAESLKAAKAQKKPVMLDMYAVWCGPCKFLDRVTFSDPAFVAWAAKSVVPVRIDAEKGQGRKLSARYAVTTFPTILFLDADGNELDRLAGAYRAPEFQKYAEEIISGRSPLQATLTKLKTQWSPADATNVASALAQRNDVGRLRPLVQRIVSDDPDLGEPHTLENLTLLAAMEDVVESLSPETADLVATFLPRLGSDPRRALLALFLSRQLLRDGDAAGAKAAAAVALKAVGDDPAKNPYVGDLLAVVGRAELKLGKASDAVATLKRSVELLESARMTTVARAARQLDLAEALAASGKKDEARAAAQAAVDVAGNDPITLSKVARLLVSMKMPTEAVVTAKRAVELSQGEDADAQAALGVALAASGDKAGGVAALRRATEFEPSNRGFRRELDALQKKAGTPKAS